MLTIMPSGVLLTLCTSMENGNFANKDQRKRLW